jgi:hypothetical protein
MKTYKPGNRPRCVAFVHPSIGVMTTCKKMADWIISPDNRAVCRDCVAKCLINYGDKIDGISFDIIIVTK